MKMLIITFQDLDFYLVVDHKQMKVINADYNVRMDLGHQKITCKSTKSMP
jgi:hypothetical protein